jgi:hypothetical protein
MEPINLTRFWDGGDRKHSSVGWEMCVLCPYVWGRVRSILLLAVWLLNIFYVLPGDWCRQPIRYGTAVGCWVGWYGLKNWHKYQLYLIFRTERISTVDGIGSNWRWSCSAGVAAGVCVWSCIPMKARCNSTLESSCMGNIRILEHDFEYISTQKYHVLAVIFGYYFYGSTW